MATDTQATTEVGVRRYRLSLGQVYRMLRKEYRPALERLELLGGVLTAKMTKHPPHNFAVGRLDRILGRMLAGPWFAQGEMSVKMGRFWCPEPDISVIRGPDDLYMKKAVRTADLGFLIEVADKSYAGDRGRKWRLYAAGRVPIYWIVNIQKRRIEVYTDPSGRGRTASYRQVSIYVEGDSAPVVLDGLEIGRIAVDDILTHP